jgi:hypothetical protein
LLSIIRSPFDGIMEGYLTLMTIKIPQQGLVSDDEHKQTYTGVKATFCHIAWRLQDEDPTQVPNFSHLRDQSPLCMGTRFVVDLWEISRAAQQYDWRNHTFAATTPKLGQGAHPPTAVVFHQTRCGSTLISNIMATFMPQHTRVYSEAPAPMIALSACANAQTTCHAGAQDALIQDVLYMMGRSPGPTLPQYVFYKFHSGAAAFLPVFRRAMPNIPYVFAYRDPVEILMSHFKNFQAGNPLSAKFRPHCLANYGTPEAEQMPLLKAIVADADGRTIDSLSKEEYCAATLASLGEAVLREHQKLTPSSSSKKQLQQWLVNYNELPYKMWETVLPGIVPFVSHEQIQNMHAVGKLYSKGLHAGEHWVEDSTLKQGRAPATVKAAAELFMEPVYAKLETYRKEAKENEK